jgi:signal transduction histidine kinase/Tfp pilus assembly protein PilF
VRLKITNSAIFFLFLLVFHSVFSQTNSDSLRQQIEQLPEKERIIELNHLAEQLSYDNPQKAIEIAKEALQLAQKRNEKIEEATAFKNLADAYYYINQIDESLKMYEISAEIEKQIHGETSENYQLRLSDIGFCLEILLRYDEANAINKKSLQIAEELDNKEQIIILLNNIGQVYYKQAKYDKAIEYFQLNLKMEQSHGKEEDLSFVFNNLGMVYMAWEQFEKAIPYFEQALQIDKKFNNEERLTIRLNNLGTAYRSLEQYEKALEFLLESLTIEKKMNRLEKVSIRLSNIAMIYASQKEFAQALEYLYEKKKILEKIDSPIQWVDLYNKLGNIHGELNDLKKAEEFLLQSQKMAEDRNLMKHQFYNLFDLANLYEKKNDYQKSLEYFHSYIALKDSLFTEEKFRQLAEFEAKYESEKKENEIVLLKKNSEIQNLRINQQRIILFGIGAGFIIILVLVFIIYQAYRREKRETQRRIIAERKLQELNKNLEKRVEEEVEIRTTQEKKAIEQSRLASLGELAAGIAHEINQPLHSVAFAVDNMNIAIEEKDADEAYLKKKCANIFHDIERMKRIIDHIRIFSRKQSVEEQEPFSLNESIENALRMVEEQYMNHKISFFVNLTEKVPNVLGNMYRFEQVVLILLSNAKDALAEQEKTMGNEFQKKISLQTSWQNEMILFEFEDNGTGIPSEIVNKIFDPFYTTKESGKGTGLGLSIAYGIINEMNGKIDVMSKPGEGAKITILLPQAPKDEI